MNRALSIVLCYAIGMVAYCVHAAKPVMSIDFSDERLQGKTPKFGLSDGGLYEQKETFWWMPSSNGNYSVIRDYEAVEEDKPYDRFDETKGNPRPEYMSSGWENCGYLLFATSVALYRTIYRVNADGSSQTLRYVTGKDIFFDQLVQFTRRDEHSNETILPFVPGEAKFVCWLPSDTNMLTVTAGFYAWEGMVSSNYTVIVTNYVSTTCVETGKWYRLTVRAIDSARTDGVSIKLPAMAMYLDGQRIACGDDYAIGADVASTDEYFRGNPHYMARALYPSLQVVTKATSSAMRGLAMRGEGKIDEIIVDNAVNPLAPGGEVDEVDVNVVVDPTKVTNLTVTVTRKSETEPYRTVTTAGEQITSVAVGKEDTVKVAAITVAEAALNQFVNFFGNLSAISTTSLRNRSYQFSMATTFSQADPVGVRVDAGYSNFEVDGKTYESVKAALDAAWGKDGIGSHKFSLNRDVVLDRSPAKDNGQMHVLPVHSLVFDLRGHMLRGDHYHAEAAIYNQGRFTIVDSVGGGSIVAPGEEAIEVVSDNTALDVNYTNAVLTLGDREITGDFTVTGRVMCTKGDLILKGGTYVTPHSLLPTSSFYLEQYIAPERFYAKEDTVRGSRPGGLWSVLYDGRYQVHFEVAHGGPVPVYTNVDTTVGAYLAAPAITNAAGYTVTNWYVKGATPQLDWRLDADAVTNDMTLVGQQRLDGYTITYSKVSQQAGWPTAYTVESAYQELPVPAKIPNYNFVGWRDNATGRAITAIGAGAKWPGTDETVTGNLALVAEWQADVLKWTNVGSYSSESNGYYSGTWRFTVPAVGDVSVGREIVVDEIAFCVVNPLTLPKSAPYLAVTPNGGSAVISTTRPMGYDPVTCEYAAATNTLANGRVKLSYRFSGLTVSAGSDNVAQFSESAGSATSFSGFLRLAVKPLADDPVFGNCIAPDDYKVYCPVYEVYGHVKGDVE